MLEGSIINIVGQLASWCIGSLINWLNSRILNPIMKVRMGATRMVPNMVPLDVTTRVEMEPTLGWFLAPTVGPNMMTTCGEGHSESNEPEEELVWGLE